MKKLFCFWLSKVKNKRLVSAGILVFLLGCISVLTSARVFAAGEPHSDASITVTQTGSITTEVVPGTFNSSSETVTVTTDNYSGYTMTTAVGSSTSLFNTNTGTYLPTITLPEGRTSITSEEFTASSWGLSSDGEHYMPFSNETILRSTNNSSNDSFNLSVGAFADINVEAGTYEQTVTLTTVANPPVISITYYENTTDTVTNMPEQDEYTINDLRLDLSDKIPVREGYDFVGWAEDANGDPVGDYFYINVTVANNRSFYAVWEPHCVGICYNKNADYATGTMADQAAAAGSTVTLEASNFSRAGYGFAGWNTKANGYGTNYGPNQTITMPASGRLWLYAKWVASEQGVTMQTFDKTAEPYASYNTGKVIGLRDERDGQVYAVAKLADGEWWMVENLRLDLSTHGDQINANNTNNPTVNFVTAATAKPASTDDNWCTTNDASCDDQIMYSNKNILNADADARYAYGIYYNWYTATAGNGTYDTTSGNVTGDICPAGWHLPTGGSDSSEFFTLHLANGGDNSHADNPEDSERWRRNPVNFPYSGYLIGSNNRSRGTGGDYWSSTAKNTNETYYLGFEAHGADSGGAKYFKHAGFAVRCIANESVTYTVSYDANGGSGAPAAQSNTNTRRGYTFTISDTMPTLSGYNFLGWATSSTATVAEYQPGDEITLSEENNTITLYPVWELPKTAKAILGSNNNLNFVYDSNTYNVNDIYTDNLGSTTIAAVYNVPVNVTQQSERPQWTSGSIREGDNNPIVSVNFDQSFYNFKPTSTAYWFYYVKNLASITNIDKLNTSDVTNMSYMFYGAGYSVATFSLDNLGRWDVSSVTNMSYMFRDAGYNATTFNLGNLGSWNVGSVTNMSYMFRDAGYNATTFNLGNLGSWNVGSVTDMSYMFIGAGYKATTFDLGNLGSWNVGSVTDMYSMFYNAGYSATTWNIGNLGYIDADHPGWNVSNVTDMSHMFYSAGHSATTFDLGNLGSWNVGSVTNMSWMFYSAGHSATTFDLGNLGSWNVGSVTNMSYMFYSAGYSATTWNIGNLGYIDADHPGWDVSNVTNMSGMFYYAGYSVATWNIGDLGSWNVSSVTNIYSMFDHAGYNATTWNIGNLGYIDADHPGWNVGSVTNMYRMFYYAGYKATTFDLGNLGSWNVSSVIDMRDMFNYAGYSATTWNISNLGYVDADHPGWNVGSVTNMSHMFYSAGYSATAFDLGNLGSWNVGSVTDMSYMFYSAGRSATTWNIGNLGYIDANHPGWNVSSVTNMESMFSYAGYNATTWNIGDISSWNVSKATIMAQMFYNAGYKATTFDLGNIGNWNVSSVTNTANMFDRAGYSATTWNIGDLGSWNVSKVTIMAQMFNYAGHSATTFDLGNLGSWNVSSVTNMSYMFNYAGRSATTWNIGNLGYIDANHPGWNVSSVTNMESMFSYAGYSATAFDLGNLGSWNVGSVTNMYSMFYGAGQNATTWNIGGISGWTVTNVISHGYFIILNTNSTNASVVNNQPHWN